MFLGLKGANKLCLIMKDQLIPSSQHVIKLLGVNIENSLKFETHVKEICKKVNQKVCAFGRLRPYLAEQKSKLLLNSVVMSNFSYCPLIWLFCSKVANNELIGPTNEHLNLFIEISVFLFVIFFLFVIETLHYVFVNIVLAEEVLCINNKNDQ